MPLILANEAWREQHFRAMVLVNRKNRCLERVRIFIRDKFLERTCLDYDAATSFTEGYTPAATGRDT